MNVEQASFFSNLTGAPVSSQDQMPVGRVNMVGSDVLITNDMDKKRQTIRVTAMFSGNKRASYKFVAETPEETINW